jgi:hypothetical protein
MHTNYFSFQAVSPARFKRSRPLAGFTIDTASAGEDTGEATESRCARAAVAAAGRRFGRKKAPFPLTK